MNANGQQILVIEDHPPLLIALKGILETAGYVILAALNGAEALQIMAEVRPDLIVSDIMMPHMDGYAIFEAIRSRPEWASIPFMFLTARTDKEHRQRAKELGVGRYITKPFEVPVLLATIRDQLEETARTETHEPVGNGLTIITPTEADTDRLLEYVWRGAGKPPPVLYSIWLCGKPAKWDLSLLRNDQVEALEAAAKF